MAKKIKNKVRKSESMYDKTFANAVWEGVRMSIRNDVVSVDYKLFNDSDAADDGDVAMNARYQNSIAVTVDPPNGKVTACLAQLSSNTNEEKLSTLMNAMLDVMSDIEIADENSSLYGGTKI